ncbi:HK97-gp10 family putative phage morphogenesis protein [Marinobacterium stanieri]|uniref:Phage protein, HK97 gp10 family n=1 Tax=Marinobacterium stanieri TaxID=49186 RepID=A0A1N6QB87_9GAMM|nr:HK97-gp10 family putative phage morphogenesis protein [Marinobacterium stanieri]SIQ13788.1 phage protein, HK97 gp10 family [Marinobacterium stanieri]
MSIQNFEVQGMAELEEALLDLGAETGFKTLRSAGRKAMEPVLIAATIGANRDSGDLKDSMAISSRKGKGGNRAVDIDVGPTKKKAAKSEGGRELSGVAHKAIAQEYGTSDQEAEPFLRPALDQNVDRVLDLFGSELGKAIARAVKKANRGK